MWQIMLRVRVILNIGTCNEISDKDLEDSSHFRVVYLGSVQLVNNIKQLVDAARILIENTRIKFLEKVINKRPIITEFNTAEIKAHWITDSVKDRFVRIEEIMHNLDE